MSLHNLLGLCPADQQLADQLGETHPMAKLIEKELAKEGEEPASTSSASFRATCDIQCSVVVLREVHDDVVEGLLTTLVTECVAIQGSQGIF